MIEPFVVNVQLKLTPLRDDPVTEDQVIAELRSSLEEIEIRVPFGLYNESAFMVEVLQDR